MQSDQQVLVSKRGQAAEKTFHPGLTPDKISAHPFGHCEVIPDTPELSQPITLPQVSTRQTESTLCLCQLKLPTFLGVLTGHHQARFQLIFSPRHEFISE